MTNKVYLSVGRGYTPAYEQFIADFERHLRAVGLDPQTVGRTYYRNQQPLKAIEGCMQECGGAIVLAFERIRVVTGVEKPGGAAQINLQDERLPTVWNQIEASMAYAMGLPLLVVAEVGLRSDGLLQDGYDWYVVSEPFNQQLFSSPAFTGVLAHWKQSVLVSGTKNNAVLESGVDLEKMSVGQLVSHMNAGQLKATVALLVGLLAGALALGYRAGSIAVSPAATGGPAIQRDVAADTAARPSVQR